MMQIEHDTRQDGNVEGVSPAQIFAIWAFFVTDCTRNLRDDRLSASRWTLNLE